MRLAAYLSATAAFAVSLVMAAGAHSQMPNGPPSVGVVRVAADGNYRNVGFCRSYPVGRPGGADRACHCLSRSTVVHRRQ